MNRHLEISLWNVQHKRLEMLLQTLADHPEYQEALAREIIATLEYFFASFANATASIATKRYAQRPPEQSPHPIAKHTPPSGAFAKANTLQDLLHTKSNQVSF